MANHELYVVQGRTLDNIAGTMRAVLGVDKDAPIRFDEVASGDKTEQINADIETQTNLIAQIKKALEGKASVSAAEIIALIDQSGVLESTDGTATDKVERLIDIASVITQATTIRFTNKPITEITLNCESMTTLANSFQNCRNLKTVKLSNTQNISAWNYTFGQAASLETLGDLNLSGASVYSNIFYGAGGLVLKNLTIVPNTIRGSITIPSAVLSGDSIQSTFGGLNSEVTGQTLTLRLVAVKKAFETSEGANDGDTSAEWLALKDSKPNWTITLS